MRASDSDRDRVADQLREALAEGRLSAEEHAERLDAVYQAKTYAELASIVEDLPATGGTRPAMTVRGDLPAPQSSGTNLVAIIGGTERKGRWLVEPQTNVVTVFGGAELDLRQAVLSQREVTINVVAVLGGVSIVVPPGLRVVGSVAAVLGGCSLPHDDAFAPDAPVLRLTGFTLLGGVDVRRQGADNGGDAFRDMDHRRIRREERRRRRELRRQARGR